MTPNVAGALTYILGFITGVLFLLIEPYKNDRFVRFHAFQSIFFNVAIVAFAVAWAVVTSVLSFITGGFLLIIFFPLGMLIYLGIFIYWLFLMYKAYNNQRYMIPYLGELAVKQSG